MGANITVNVKVSKAEAQSVVEQIRKALESITSEPVNISVTQNVISVDSSPISVYNRRRNRDNTQGR